MAHSDMPEVPSNADPSDMTSNPVHRSVRVTKPLSYLQDFRCNLLASKPSPPARTPYPLDHYLSYAKLSASHSSFILTVSSTFEPQHYHQAVQYAYWKAAKLDAMQQNQTWSVTTRPPAKHSIGCKWVYKVKYKSDRTIECYKAHLSFGSLSFLCQAFCFP